MDFNLLRQGAEDAERLLKSLSNSNRLLILCQLIDGEKAVNELEDAIGIRQPTLSQQLARLRKDRMVDARRDGKTIFYRLASEESRAVIELLYGLYCSPNGPALARRLEYATVR
ncbi:MAG: helix-turn-helix transcriptional regulator [Inquilinus sp.]|nr:helix-turn-helix transcriptional regulator [Inquilinus sp.]